MGRAPRHGVDDGAVDALPVLGIAAAPGVVVLGFGGALGAGAPGDGEPGEVPFEVWSDVGGVSVGRDAGFTSTPDITQTPLLQVNPLAGCAVTHPLARPAPPPPVLDTAAASGGCQ